MRGRLNLFQSMMLRWRDLHPYSAVHVIRVNKPCEPAALKAHIEAQLEHAGLTGLVLDRVRSRYEFEGGPAAIEFAKLAGGADPQETARLEIVRQLNTPFPREGRFVPFRFFAIDCGTCFDLGLAYDHFIAGGDSIAVLLRYCAQGYLDGAGRGRQWAPRLYPHTYRRLLLRNLGSLLRGLGALPSLVASCRRSHRAPCAAAGAPANGFLCFRIDSAAVEALRRTARDWGVTIGDLFLAMLLLSVDPLAAGRHAAKRRTELAVASIVNLRSEVESDAHDCFGQFLSSLRLSHPVAPGTTVRELALAAHAETRRVRAGKLYLQSLLALAVAGAQWRFLSPERRGCFLAKHYPIWAGLSAVHVDPLWQDEPDDALPSEYLRAVSTGPLAPLVFAITTLAGAMWLGVSYRTPDVGAEAAERTARAFLDHIRSLG